MSGGGTRERLGRVGGGLLRLSELFELGEHGVNVFERLINVLTSLPTGEDDFTGHENQEHNLRHLHSVNQTGKELGLILREVSVLPRQTL